MKKTVIFPLFSAFLFCFLCAACKEPSPLYGTWADNLGNTLSFFEDDTFNAKITVAGGIKTPYEGSYSVLMNALTLSCTNVVLRVVTEWDIRGNMLYLNWTNEYGVTLPMTLYKISN